MLNDQLFALLDTSFLFHFFVVKLSLGYSKTSDHPHPPKIYLHPPPLIHKTCPPPPPPPPHTQPKYTSTHPDPLIKNILPPPTTQKTSTHATHP